jgi:hypothetical protein
MRSRLEVRSPSHGTGWAETWVFSGNDDRVLRDCLDELEAFRAPDGADRWTAALVFEENPSGTADVPRTWTPDGARRLAELLPEQLTDLRDAIGARFGRSERP